MYHIKEVTIRGKQATTKERNVLVIEFSDPNKAILGEFLMTDALLMNFGVLQDIELVLSGKEKTKTVSGNRCALEINADKTVLSDLMAGLFDGVQTYPNCEVKTVELRDLIKVWQAEKAKHERK